jgi:crotonobetainyl-CoA:carnitine CoA-transferase CaiB-like acyl-CoA transferase
MVRKNNYKIKRNDHRTSSSQSWYIKITNTPLRLSKTPVKIETTAPLLGQHTEEPDFIIGRTSLSNGSALFIIFLILSRY